MPLFQLPQLITQLVNAQVAMNRLQQFLAAKQKPPELLLEPASKGESACLWHALLTRIGQLLTLSAPLLLECLQTPHLV